MVRGIFSFRTVFYLVYAVILTVVLLYVRFPKEKFKLFCERSVASFLADSTCSIEHIAYSFPFTLVVTNFHIVQEVEEGHSNFRISSFSFKPKGSNLFRSLAVNGAMYGGNFFLNLDIDGEERSFRMTDVLVKGFNVDEWTKDFGQLDRKASGIAEFSGNYQASFDGPLAGIGKGHFTAIDGGLEFIQPILSLSTFEFGRIDLEMTNEKGLLKFSKGEVVGKEISAVFTGEIKMVTPLQNSNILLTGQLVPEKDFLEAHPEEQRIAEQLFQRYKMTVLPFKVGGSVRRPIFRFSM